jgi:hypothetical protein
MLSLSSGPGKPQLHSVADKKTNEFLTITTKIFYYYSNHLPPFGREKSFILANVKAKNSKFDLLYDGYVVGLRLFLSLSLPHRIHERNFQHFVA